MNPSSEYKVALDPESSSAENPNEFPIPSQVNGPFMNLNALSTADLSAELARRQKATSKLEKQRDKLLAQIEAIEADLAKLGRQPSRTPRGGGAAVSGAGPRKRPKNELTLADALAGCAELGAVVSPQEAVDLVLKNGYKSSSATFGGQVANALAKHPQFKKRGRAQYERCK
jgi:hypothetical protein